MTPAYDLYLDALINDYTTTDDDAELARDEAFATWCDEHRDAWIAETAEEVSL